MSNIARPIYPRITKSYAKSLIAEEKIIIDVDMCVVICIAKLVNDHRLITHAIVANSGLFDADKGTQIARDKMLDVIMDLEMYQMRTCLQEERSKEITHAE